jgi:uncharacterized repeat protein (TIGR01451 family)
MKISMNPLPNLRLPFALCCVALAALSTLSLQAQERQTLHGHVPSVVGHLQSVGRLPATNRLNLVIGLPLRNKPALTNLLQQIHDPASPLYHQYLTPQQFADQFGPDPKDYKALDAFLSAHHLTPVGYHPNRMLMDVNGTVADIEATLHTTLGVYEHPTEQRLFYAPQSDPSLDLNLTVLHVSGLDNYILPHPASLKGKPLTKGTKAVPNAGSGPLGSYMGNDFRAAYIPGTYLTGSRQVVGLLQFDGYNTSDILKYESQAGLPNVPLENVLLDGFSGVPTPFGNDVEVCLDIEMAISMAPGLSKVIVYEAGPFGFPEHIMNRMATDDQANQLSASWGWSGGPSAVIDQIAQQMVAQGQSFFHSSGDNDALLPGQVDDPSQTFAPSDSPYMTQVGGTTLTTSGPGGSWLSETVWNWDLLGAPGIGSTGGISSHYSIPAWQQGIDMTAAQGSTTMRNLPDVALTADNVYVISENGLEFLEGGTSCASPLWAGFAALINQQADDNGLPAVGFLNPALYSIGKGPSYTSGFHDITTGNNTWSNSPTLFPAVSGYDLATGWGTPAGTNLINLLAPPASSPLPYLAFVGDYVTGGNGNGVVDFDECNNFFIIVTNQGRAAASDIQATLSSATPGAYIAQNSSLYPDLPPNGIGTNLSAFKISTTPDFIAGTPIHLALRLKFDQGSTTLRFQLPTGLPGTPPLRFDAYGDTNFVGAADYPIQVSNMVFAIQKVTVSCFIDYTYDIGLLVQLVSPDGVTNTLSAYNGMAGSGYGVACGPDSFRVTFDDDAVTPIASGSAPFVGTFQPQQPLSIFKGKSGAQASGAWKLHVVDTLGGIYGNNIIHCASLFITPTLSVDGGGECPGSDMAISMTAQPDPVIVGDNLTYFISVTNNGPSTTTNVTVSQILPNSVLFVSATPSQGGFSQSTGVLTCNLGKMAPKAVATITVVVTPTAAGVISSSATVAASDQIDPDLSNNTALTNTHVNPPSADLAVGLTAAPASTFVGNPVTYTVSVTNNGPVGANFVIASNVLPVNSVLRGVTVPQGASYTIAGNVVVCYFGGLAVGARAVATISAAPSAEGTLVATSTVSGSLLDPISANNTAFVSIVVTPATDLALGLTGLPNPVITGSNLTYTVVVTNLGPSIASAVGISTTLDPSLSIVSTTVSQGSSTVSGNSVTASLGTLAQDVVVTNIIVATTSASAPNGTVSASATVSGSEADPDSANNSATVTTLISQPFISITPGVAALTSESGPINGAIDIGETVTVTLPLLDVGNIATTNLVAVLLATNGVTPVAPNNPHTYGRLSPSPNLVAVLGSFTFTANGANGGAIAAVLHLTDGPGFQTNVAFNFTLPNTVVFANTNSVAIRDINSALPYPSTINVSGLSGTVGKATVTLSNLNHSFVPDIDALVVGPAGQNTMLMSGAGYPYGVSGSVTFDDDTNLPVIPANDLILSGSYRPADYLPGTNLPAPALAGPYPAAMSALNGASPNGAWSLYVDDHRRGDTGSIAGGWSLALTMISPVNQTADLGITAVSAPNPVKAGTYLTNVFTVTNSGPDAVGFVTFTSPLLPGQTLVADSSSQGSLTVNGTAIVGNLGALNTNASVTVTIVVSPGYTLAGLMTNSASVSAASGEIDLNPANNTVAVVTAANLPVADLVVRQTAAPNPVTIGSNLTYTVTVTNNGPETALSVVLTNGLSSGAFASAASTRGTCSIQGRAVTCALGDLIPNAGAVVTLGVVPAVQGALTNTAGAGSASIDTNSANNSSLSVVTVAAPAPQVVAASAVLTYESGPVNGAIDPGETVTVSLGLRNVGAINTTNLAATLLTTNGISPIAPISATYGALAAGGGAVARAFSFTAASVNGGVINATLQLQDGAKSLPPVAFSFNLATTSPLANTTAISIPDHGIAGPYPSTITVSGLTGQVSRVTATLNGLSHGFVHDVNVLLVDPSNASVLLMAHTGGAHSVSNLTLTFDDRVSSPLPPTAALVTGTYQPGGYGTVVFPGPAPAGPYGSTLSALNWSNPNGDWKLYVYDDSPGDSGSISGGWSLNLTTVQAVNPVLDLAVTSSSVPVSVVAGHNLTNTVTVTNSGPADATGLIITDTLPAGASLVSVSGGSFVSTNGQVVCSIGNLAANGSASVTIVAAPAQTGFFTNSVIVAANEEDLNTNNNSAQSIGIVLPGAVTLSGLIQGGYFHLTATGQAGVNYVIQSSTNLVSWTPISTNTAAANNTITFTDSNSPGFKYRFFRVLQTQ